MPLHPRLVLLFLLAVTALVAAAPAHAATVSMTAKDVAGESDDEFDGSTRAFALVYSAAPGEANDLTLSATEGEIVVSEAAVDIAPGTGCQAVDARRVRCATQTTANVTDRRVTIELGDGNDQFRIGAAELDETIVRGGPGDDQLTGANGDDMLEGGPGRDRISAGEGLDTVQGGAEDDQLDGGPGQDQLSYADRTTGVVADLAQPTAGAEGERDDIAGFESAAGGSGDDTLGGATLAADCGAGHDAVGLQTPVARDLLLPRSCEIAGLHVFQARARPKVTRRALRFRLLTNSFDGNVGRITVRDARTRKIVGRGRTRRGDPRDQRVTVRLTATGRRLVRRGSLRGLLVTYRGRDGGSGGYSVQLR